jgi:hypothetical protein
MILKMYLWYFERKICFRGNIFFSSEKMIQLFCFFVTFSKKENVSHYVHFLCNLTSLSSDFLLMLDALVGPVTCSLEISRGSFCPSR